MVYYSAIYWASSFVEIIYTQGLPSQCDDEHLVEAVLVLAGLHGMEHGGLRDSLSHLLMFFQLLAPCPRSCLLAARLGQQYKVILTKI